MKRVILFRFHKKPLVCKNHLVLLKKYNPQVPIYGLYGGSSENFLKVNKFISKEITHIYSVAHQTNKWKWENSDLAVRQWFRDFGYNLDFDTLHVVEWDLLFFDSITNIYRHVPPNSLGLTGLQPLKNVENRWSWTTEEPTKSNWLRFKAKIKKKYGLPKPIMVCLGPGPVFPKSFLHAFIKTPVSTLVHDEIRLPIMASILGFKLSDTKLYKHWFDDQEKTIFNCVNREINTHTIIQEMSKTNGRRVFHPFRKKWQSQHEY
jgi:hypothetical protein